MRKAMLALAAALAACSGGVGKIDVSTKVAAAGGGTTALAAVPAPAALTLAEGLSLDRARLLIRKVMLQDFGDGETEGATIRWAPQVVDLSGAELDGGVVFLLGGEVPAGTYDQLTFQLHKLTPGDEAVMDGDFSPLGASIVLDLTLDGEPFQFTSDLTAVGVIPGPFTVEEGGTANVTVTIDPAGWFTGPMGEALDPRLEEDRSRIEWNVMASIRGFQDDDADGTPDDDPDDTP